MDCGLITENCRGFFAKRPGLPRGASVLAGPQHAWWTEGRAVDRGSTVDRGRDWAGAHDGDVVRGGGSPE